MEQWNPEVPPKDGPDKKLFYLLSQSSPPSASLEQAKKAMDEFANYHESTSHSLNMLYKSLAGDDRLYQFRSHYFTATEIDHIRGIAVAALGRIRNHFRNRGASPEENITETLKALSQGHI